MKHLSNLQAKVQNRIAWDIKYKENTDGFHIVRFEEGRSVFQKQSISYNLRNKKSSMIDLCESWECMLEIALVGLL